MKSSALARIIGCLSAAISFQALGAAGELDPGYGRGGMYRPAPVCCDDNHASATTVQPDGKRLLAGFVDDEGVALMLVMRLNEDGTLDSTFGIDGMFRLSQVPRGWAAEAIAIDSSGRVLVAGWEKDAQDAKQGLVVRLNAAGRLDGTFGTHGVRRIGALQGITTSIIRSLVAAADGTIVIAGGATRNGDRDMFAARLDANGAFDTAFGASGIAFSGLAGNDDAWAAALTWDARVLLVGDFTSSGVTYPAAVRFTAAGLLDNTFDGDGRKAPIVGLAGTARAAIHQPDGMALVAGAVNAQAATMRLDGAGELDTGYGTSGVFRSGDATASVGTALLADAAGSYLMLSETTTTSGPREVVARRVLPNGGFDGTWVAHSQQIPGVGSTVAADTRNAAFARFPDGRVSVAASTTASYGYNALAYRLLATGALDSSPGSQATPPAGLDELVYTLQQVAIAPDGRAYVFRRVIGADEITRLDTRGRIDTSFGTAGKALVSTGTTPSSLDEAFGWVRFDSQGRLLVTNKSCTVHIGGGSCSFFLNRVLPTGSLDPGFVVSSAGSELFPALELYPDGRILFGSVRRMPDGGADPSFTPAETGLRHRAATIMADGGVAVGGYRTANANQAAVARLTDIGALDFDFGANGVRDLTLGGTTRIDAMRTDTSGRLLIAGTACPSSCFVYVKRLLANGSDDPGFAGGGHVQVTLNMGNMTSATVLRMFTRPDGRIIVTGTSFSGLGLRPYIAAILPHGALDTTWGVEGVSLMGPAGGHHAASGADMDAEGHVYLSGFLNGAVVQSGPGTTRNVPGFPVVMRALGNDLELGPNQLPPGSPGRAYSVQLTGSGGTSPYTFSLVEGSLPPGLTFSETGISGTPSGVGEHDFRIRITDSAGRYRELPLTLQVHTAASLISSYYDSILRRDPDSEGQAYWQGEMSRLQGLGAHPSEVFFAMAAFFFGSTEYATFGRDNEGFVTDLYATFFGRAPDPGGLQYWVSQLLNGMPREVVLASFMFSAEFGSYTAAIFGADPARPEVNMVLDFYRGLLARLPDEGGFNAWVQHFRAAQYQGQSAVAAAAEQISSAFATSGEYAARGRSNAQYVGDLYNAFLRRGGDLQGVHHWINQLQNGSMTREQVRQAFVAAAEFQQRVGNVSGAGCLP